VGTLRGTVYLPVMLVLLSLIGRAISIAGPRCGMINIPRSRAASSEQAFVSSCASIVPPSEHLVAAYTGIVYWVFRGKVKLDEHSY